MRLTDIVVAVVASLAVVLALWRLEGARAGLVFDDVTIGETPATVIHREDLDAPVPLVVIAHGFAGAKELMEPFAVTLARAGYLTVSFDFVGHGRHPASLPMSIEGPGGAADRLLDQLDRVIAEARALPLAGEDFALLGHSMATDLLAKRAAETEGAEDGKGAVATVMVSPFSRDITAETPENMLSVVGGWEMRLTEEALRTVNLTAEAIGAAPVGEGETVGAFEDGTARRAVFSDGVEHIGVLYDPEGLAAAVEWLDAAFGREGQGGGGPSAVEPDARGPWIGLLFAGLIALGRPLSRVLPVLAAPPAGAGASWRTLGLIAAGAGVAAPLLATLLPRGLMPIVVGDYLAQHFFAHALFTALGLWLAARRGLVALPPRAALVPILPGLALGAAAVGVWTLLAFALSLDRYAFPFLPTPDRAALVPVLFAALLPWFLADEWLTRGARRPGDRAARVGPYALTKVVFVLSLALAVALDPGRLFFLLIVAPVILVFFGVYGLLSHWAMTRTGHPWVAGAGIAFALAWSIATSFPLFEA